MVAPTFMSVVRGVHVYKAVWTLVGLVRILRGSVVGMKKLLINFWYISLTANHSKLHMGSNYKRQEKLIEEGGGIIIRARKIIPCLGGA